jgi:formylglycine-generating enzyme required for sulfatase activity
MQTRQRWAGILFLAAELLAAAGVRANNLQVKNVTVSGRDDSTAYVKFDISWENSWRYTNFNHDAAWVFFKVLPQGSNAWQHVKLAGTGVNPPNYATGRGTRIELIVPPDRVGLFMRRSANGTGTTSVQNVKAVWNFVSNGLVKTDNVLVQALAVEMVLVPEGSFKVGSGGTETGSFTDGSWSSGATLPFEINGSWDRQITNAPGKLWGTSTTSWTSIGGAGSVNANYPSGYNAFYCMKYEVTQGQYRDFLNALTRAQQTTRTASLVVTNFAMTASTTTVFRNGIRCPSVIPSVPTRIAFGCDANANLVFNEADDGMDRACNRLSFLDGAAFADWAGLRPMTELEFEKACRGPLRPVVAEYAWGASSAPTLLVSEVGDGTGASTADPAPANCLFTGGQAGPARGGIFATATSTRAQAGASYWGILELSGNLWERPVSVGHAANNPAVARAFTGLQGDGNLTPTGDADVPTWPDKDAVGVRGGSVTEASTSMRVSDRSQAARQYSTRYNNSGWRGVRTAPAGVGP